MNSGAFIRAELSLRTTAEGGRRRPVVSGYRPNFWIGHLSRGKRVYNDGMILLEGIEQLEPGSSAIARIQPALPDLWSHMMVGTTIDVCEGSRVVGTARVIEVMNHRSERTG